MIATAYNKQTNKEWLATESLLKLDGVNGKKVVIPSSTNLDFNPYIDSSISMVLTRPVTVTSNSVFLSKRDSGSSTAPGYGFYFHTNNTQIGFEAYNGTTDLSGFLTLSCTKGFLFHMIITYTASTKLLKLYCNGALSGSTTLGTPSGSYASVSPVKVGAYTSSAGTDALGYSGNGSHLAFYNKALTQLEIDSLYNEVGLVPKSLHPYCVGFWTMQERYGNKAYDSVEQFNYAKEVITNANTGFDTDTVWTKTGTWVISGGVASAETTTLNNSGFHNVLRAAPVIAGHTYRVRFKVLECSGGVPGVYVILGNTLTGIVYGVGTYDVVLTALSGGFIGIQQVVNGTVGYRVVIDDLIFDAYSHRVLSPNHGDLIGYTDAELGITDKTTQTAKVDFYTKSVVNRWNGSGNEVKTGLPELKNALKVQGYDHSGQYFQTSIPVQTSGVLTFYSAFYMDLDADVVGRTRELTVMSFTKDVADYYNYNSNLSLRISHNIKGTMYVDVQGTVIGGIANCINNGFNSAVVTIENGQGTTTLKSRLRVWINGRLVAEDRNLSNYVFDDITRFKVGNHYLYDYYFTGRLIASGCIGRVLTLAEIYNLNNNGLLANPISKNWICYHNYNSVDTTSGQRILDVSGNNRHASILGTAYTANNLNPAHADYAIKTINSLR